MGRISYKLPNWEMRLIRFVNDELGKPFDWGKRDCSTLAVSCLREMVGDLDTPWPPFDYTNEREAVRFAKGKLSFHDFLIERFDARPVKPNFEQRGDFIFGHNGLFDCCHVVLGQKAVSVDPEQGVCQMRVKDLNSEDRRVLRIL